MPATATIAAFRFGYGLPLPAGAPDGPAGLRAALAGPDLMAERWPGPHLADATAQILAIDTARRAAKQDVALKAAYTEANRQAESAFLSAAQATLARALDAPDGLRERLVAFWADHFTVATKNPRDRLMPAALVNDAIRPHLTGRFAHMLRAVTLHPAMLGYLNQNSSIGPNSPQGKRGGKGLNENLGRELLELHTLGVGASYSQQDVTQMAKLLTGATFDAQSGFVFRERWAEPGAETVLGVTYPGTGTAPILAALEDLAQRPETAAHLARKLAVHFVADDPDPGLVAALQAAWQASGGDLTAVYAALLDHPAAWAPLGAKARQPFEFLVAALRALGQGGAEIMAMDEKTLRRIVMNPMQAMGQPWQRAPGPNGWPEAPEAWITPQHLAVRISWAMAMPQKLVSPLPDPRRLVGQVLGDAAGERVVWAAQRAENTRAGVGVILASPEFNRR